MSLEELAGDMEGLPELGPVPADQEYEVELTRLIRGTSSEEKGGRSYLMASLDFPEVATAQELSHFIGFIPEAGDSSKQATKEKMAIRDFLRGMNLPFSILAAFEETENGAICRQAVGSKGRCIVGCKTDKRDGKLVNFIKQWTTVV